MTGNNPEIPHYVTAEDILSHYKADPVPDEQTEEIARDLRMLYTALLRQHFTEDQALTILGQAIAAMIAGAILEGGK